MTILYSWSEKENINHMERLFCTVFCCGEWNGAFQYPKQLFFRVWREFDVQCHREYHVQYDDMGSSMASTHPLARSLSQPVIIFSGDNRRHRSGRQIEERNSKLFWFLFWMGNCIQNWCRFSRCLLQQILHKQHREYVNMYPDFCTVHKQITNTCNKFRTCKLWQLHSRNVGMGNEKSRMEIHVEHFQIPNDEHVCFGWSSVYCGNFGWDKHRSWNFNETKKCVQLNSGITIIKNIHNYSWNKFLGILLKYHTNIVGFCHQANITFQYLLSIWD